jgi:hypothetical protein
MITGTPEVFVVGALLLLAVDRDLGADADVRERRGEDGSNCGKAQTS